MGISRWIWRRRRSLRLYHLGMIRMGRNRLTLHILLIPTDRLTLVRVRVESAIRGRRVSHNYGLILHFTDMHTLDFRPDGRLFWERSLSVDFGSYVHFQICSARFTPFISEKPRNDAKRIMSFRARL